MKSWYWAGLGLTVVAISTSCSSMDCGPGTIIKGNECVAPPVDGGNRAGNGDGSDGHAGNSNGGDGTDPGTGGGTAPNGGDAGTSSAGSAGSDGGTDGSSAGSGGSDDLITTALDCGSRDVTGATVITEPITQDTTWSGLIHLPNGLSVRNEPTLTIAPGTKIIVGHNASVEFGYLASHATIVANGTLDNPIKFCGEIDSPGYWAGLIFRSGLKTASVLRNVLIADGGATDAGLTLEMSLLVQGVQVRNSGANGVNAAGFAAASSKLTVSGSTNAAVKATAAQGVEVPSGSQLTGNGSDVIDVGFTSFDTGATFRNRGVPYRQLADTTSATSAAPVVTFEPGVVYWIARQKVLNFGAAAVHALGSVAQPVVFQGMPCTQPNTQCLPNSASDATDSGGRLEASGSDIVFGYVELRKLGWSISSSDNWGALSVNSGGQLKVDHLTISDATAYGLEFAGVGQFSADSNNLTVGMAQSGPAFVLACSPVSTLPADTTITSANRYTALSCLSVGTAATSWGSAGSPYQLLGGLIIPSGGSLALQPGTTLRFGSSPLTVKSGGTLTAIGTPSANIQFVRDATTADHWGGIYADTGSIVKLDYVLVDQGGANGGAGVTAVEPITLTHSTISNSQQWGLMKSATDATDYSIGNAFLGNPVANIATLP